jgi:tetraacyldisaccharide 4'-kinase
MPNKKLNLRQRIESVMRSEGRTTAPLLALWLYIISIIYGMVQKLRGICYRHKILSSMQLPCKVISIGNITVGGTGKTPMTILVAAALKQSGYKVAIVSRGYKGGAERRGGIVSDGRKLLMDPDQSGDESFLIACRLKDIPVIVGKNRFAAGMLAVNLFQSDVIVLDDAFQHLKLKRDIDLLLLDCMRPFGNSHLLPRGILREPVSSLTRSTACILTRCRHAADDTETLLIASLRMLSPESPIFRSTQSAYCYIVKKGQKTPSRAVSKYLRPCDLAGIKKDKIFGFSGIARNDDFQRTVEEMGFNLVGFLEFTDHHDYTEDDLKKILSAARTSGACRLITTDKDHVRIAHKKSLPMELVVVGVEVTFGNAEREFVAFIKDRLKI